MPARFLSLSLRWWILLGATVQGSLVAAGTIFQTDFETSEGYAAGASLIGQNGWNGLSPITPLAAGVASDPVQQPALGQFGFIGGFLVPVPGIDNSNLVETKQIVSRDIPYTPGVNGGNALTVVMDLVPYYDDPDSLDQFGIVLRNSADMPLCTVALAPLASQLIVIDQLDEAGLAVITNAHVSGTRYELRFELDFGANIWNAWFGPQHVAVNRRLFEAGMAADLGSIAFTWGRYTLFPDTSANHYLIFDRLRAVANPPVAPNAVVTLALVPNTPDLDVSVQAAPGAMLALQYSPALAGNWSSLQSFMVPAGGVFVFRHVGVRASPRGFYRVAGPPGG